MTDKPERPCPTHAEFRRGLHERYYGVAKRFARRRNLAAAAMELQLAADMADDPAVRARMIEFKTLCERGPT